MDVRCNSGRGGDLQDARRLRLWQRNSGYQGISPVPVFVVSVKDADKISCYYERFFTYMEKEHHLQIDRRGRREKWLMPQIRPNVTWTMGEGVFFLQERPPVF